MRACVRACVCVPVCLCVLHVDAKLCSLLQCPAQVSGVQGQWQVVVCLSQCKQPVALPQGDWGFFLPLAHPCHLCSRGSLGRCCALLIRFGHATHCISQTGSALQAIVAIPSLFLPALLNCGDDNSQPSATCMQLVNTKHLQMV